jgi:hypothetical protein
VQDIWRLDWCNLGRTEPGVELVFFPLTSSLAHLGRCRPLWGVVYRPPCMAGRSITAIWVLIGRVFSSNATPQAAGADHWWHRGTRATGVRRFLPLAAQPQLPAPLFPAFPRPCRLGSECVPSSRRPTSLSNSAELALTPSRRRPMGPAHLHMRVRIATRWAPRARGGERGGQVTVTLAALAFIMAAVQNTHAGLGVMGSYG